MSWLSKLTSDSCDACVLSTCLVGCTYVLTNEIIIKVRFLTARCGACYLSVLFYLFPSFLVRVTTKMLQNNRYVSGFFLKVCFLHQLV